MSVAFDPGSPDEPDIVCEICGGSDCTCSCEECPVCGVTGDPECIKNHGLNASIPLYENNKYLKEELRKANAEIDRLVWLAEKAIPVTFVDAPEGPVK